ncbi:MAG: hypothetical protein PVH89_08960 [Gammaproteobacteria bacterium]|jgi:TolB-like protein
MNEHHEPRTEDDAVDRYLALDASRDDTAGGAPASDAVAATDRAVFARCDAVMALAPKLAESADTAWAFEEARRIARSGPEQRERPSTTRWYLGPWPAWGVAGALAIALALALLPASESPLPGPTPGEAEPAVPNITFAPIVISTELARSLAEVEPVVALTDATARSSELPAPGVWVDGRSLAVLPFAASGDFSGGGTTAASLYEQVVRQLRSIPGLYLIDSATAAVYAGSDLPAEEIARQLGVRGIVEGQIEAADSGDIRFELSFTDASASGNSIREAIERPTEELVLLQSDIASTVLGALARPRPGPQADTTL